MQIKGYFKKFNNNKLISLKLFVIALTWRIVYIGQASDSEKDQILEEAEMDEIQPGQMKFVFEVITHVDFLIFIIGSTT